MRATREKLDRARRALEEAAQAIAEERKRQNEAHGLNPNNPARRNRDESDREKLEAVLESWESLLNQAA